MAFLQRTMNRGSVSTGYDIDNSAAFGGANGIQFNPSSDGNKRTWTVSLWLKRSELSTETTIFGAQNTAMVLMDPDWFRFSLYTGSATYYFDTENSGPVYRDTSAWYNFVFQCDTTQGTAADRAKLWVNGESVTNTNSNTIPQNAEFDLNDNTKNIQVGYFYAGNEQLDGYLSEIHFTDGVANDADAFGEYDNDSGIWKPKAYAGSYGTNGFYLEFKESAASATGIGKDTSGNGNNFSTGGTYPSQATDTPTNNFCTMNPYAPYLSRIIAASDFTNGATQVTKTNSNAWCGAIGTMGVKSGKWYYEARVNDNDNLMLGFSTFTGDTGANQSPHTIGTNIVWYGGGASGSYWFYHIDSGSQVSNSSNRGTVWSNGDVLGVALDIDNSRIDFYVNGSLAGSSNTNVDISATVNEIDSTGDFLIPFIAMWRSQFKLNFGGYTTHTISSAASDANGYGTFEYAPPSGYYALCTKNLAEYGG